MSATVIAPAPDRFSPGTLTTPDGLELPLVSVNAEADVAGLLAGWKLTQTYTNPTDDAVEVLYTFPLPGRFAVRDVVFVSGERRIRADIAERAEARERYEVAISQGRSAALVEEDRPEVFTVSLGNLAARSVATVELYLAGQLPVVDGTVELRLPTTVAQRYVSDEGDAPDATRVTPPRSDGPDASIVMDITVRMDAPRDGNLETPPGFSGRGGDGRWTVASPAGFVPTGDVFVRWSAPDAVRPVAVAIRDDDAGLDSDGVTVVVTMPAGEQSALEDRDVVVLLDRSGSMGSGTLGSTDESVSMDIARRAAGRIVDSLADRDRFAVIGFNTTMVTPWEGWRQATDANRFAAVRFLSGLEAKGGTSLPAAVRQALAQFTPTEGRTQVLIVVTDALVAAEDATLRAAAATGGTTVHGVAIGPFANAGLLDRLAAATGGTAVVVNDAERLDATLDGLRRRVAAPVLTDVRIERHEATEVTPRRADLHTGIPLVLAARMPQVPAELTVVATSSATGEERRFRVTVVESTNPAVHAAWARARVRDLEDLRVTGVTAPGEDAPPAAAQIVAHSIAHRVLCRYTAFIAVDDDGARLEVPAQRTLTQPIAGSRRSKGVGGVQSASFVSRRVRAMSSFDDGGLDTARFGSRSSHRSATVNEATNTAGGDLAYGSSGIADSRTSDGIQWSGCSTPLPPTVVGGTGGCVTTWVGVPARPWDGTAPLPALAGEHVRWAVFLGGLRQMLTGIRNFTYPFEVCLEGLRAQRAAVELLRNTPEAAELCAALERLVAAFAMSGPLDETAAATLTALDALEAKWAATADQFWDQPG